MALQEAARQLNSYLPTVASKVETAVRNTLLNALQQTPEYSSLVAGPLTGHFGFRDGKSRADAIIQAAASSVKCRVITARNRGANITGGLEITAVPADFGELLSLPQASVDTAKGSLPWLEWLLTRGDSIIIADYGIAFGDFKSSRSGEAIMMKGLKAYKIPIGVSGTLQDNWFTRCISTMEHTLEAAIAAAM